MSLVASYPSPAHAMSTLHELNDFQLCLILQSTIPRLDVLHKILNFIKTTKLDGKAFMGLSNRKLADLASHDPLTISRFQRLRGAQPQDIQLLLESRWKRPQSPEPTPSTQEQASYTQDTHDEGSTDPVLDPHSQPHPSEDLPTPVPHNLAPDTLEAAAIFTNVEAENVSTLPSTEAPQIDSNGSSINREFSSHHMAPDETPSNPQPEVAAEVELSSPIDPHSVPLPQPHNSELDLPNVEEDDIYDDETFSVDEVIDSELEAYTDGLSSDDDTSDDESQAWSLVSNEEIGEAHVSVENEAADLQGESPSPADATHESHIEPQSVTPEEPSIVDDSNVDASPAAQSPPVAESDPGIDQIISADDNSTLPSELSEPDGQHAKAIEKQREAEVSLPTSPPAENNESQHDISSTINDDLPSSINQSEHETSAGVPEAKESSNSTPAESVETDQSSPANDDLDSLRTIHATREQPTTSPPQPMTPGSTEGDEANAESTSATMEEETPEVPQPSETVSTEGYASRDVVNDPPSEQPDILTDSDKVINPEETHSEETRAEQPPLSAAEELTASPFESATPEDGRTTAALATPEVIHPSDTGSTEVPSENVVNELPEGQPDSTLVPNEVSAIHLEETHSESTQAEQPVPSLSNLLLFNPPELYPAPAAIVVHPIAEELNPTTSEHSTSLSAAPTDSAKNDDIPIIQVVHSPVRVSIEMDISASASPSSSTRSIFSDSPFSNRLHSEFHFVAPVSPVLGLDKCNVLLFCEGVCDDYSTILTSPSIDVTHFEPFSSHLTGYDDDADAQDAGELRLVDHPLPINDDTEPDDPMSFLFLEEFFYDPFALAESSHQNGEPASSSNDNLIDFLDEDGAIDKDDAVPSVVDTILVPVESPLVDEGRAAEENDSALLMRDDVPVFTLPGALGMNEGQFTDDTRVDGASILPEETDQQPSNEADPVVALIVASGTNEAQDIDILDDNQEAASMVSTETVPLDPTSAMHGSDPVDPLSATFRMNEGQTTDDNQVEDASILSNDSVHQAPDETTSTTRDPVVSSPVADDLPGVDEEIHQQVSNESTSPSIGTEDHSTPRGVEPSRFKGLPLINTNITSLSDDLSAYMSPTHNPIVHAPYPTPFSSRSQLSPSGSPGSPRSLFPRGESSTSEKVLANYTKRFQRPTARSIAIQTELESLNLQRRIEEENSANVASASVSPLSTFLSSLFRLSESH